MDELMPELAPEASESKQKYRRYFLDVRALIDFRDYNVNTVIYT